MDEFLNACSAWPPGVSTENAPANQVTWPTPLLLAWVYTKLPPHQYSAPSREHRVQERNCQAEGRPGKGRSSPPAFPTSLGVQGELIDSRPHVWHRPSPQRLPGIYMLRSLAILFLTSGLRFTGTASPATISHGKEKFAQERCYK